MYEKNLEIKKGRRLPRIRLLSARSIGHWEIWRAFLKVHEVAYLRRTRKQDVESESKTRVLRPAKGVVANSCRFLESRATFLRTRARAREVLLSLIFATSHIWHDVTPFVFTVRPAF